MSVRNYKGGVQQFREKGQHLILVSGPFVEEWMPCAEVTSIPSNDASEASSDLRVEVRPGLSCVCLCRKEHGLSSLLKHPSLSPAS